MEELDRIREYFEDRADASCEPGDDRFRGNREMSLLQDVETVTRALSDGANARAAECRDGCCKVTQPARHETRRKAPCPFCSCTEVDEIYHFMDRWYTMGCAECGADGPPNEKPEEALLLWNKRLQSCTKLEWALRQGDVLADWCNVSGAALAALMDAFERRARSHCTAAEIEREPWRCSEFIEAERALTSKPVPVVSIDASGVPACAECGALPDEKCVHQVNHLPLLERIAEICDDGPGNAKFLPLNFEDAYESLREDVLHIGTIVRAALNDSQSVAGKKS